MNLSDFFDRSVRSFPNRTAFLFGDDKWSYREAQDTTTRTAHGLAALGVKEGMNCGVLSRNHPHLVLSMLGIVKAGGTWVPVNPANGYEQNLEIIKYFDVQILFYEAGFEDFVRQAYEASNDLTHLICLDGESPFGMDFRSWVGEQLDVEIVTPWNPDGVCMIRPTGGTTGRPKGVMNTNRNLAVTIANFLSCAELVSVPRYLANIPLTHASGILSIITLAAGGTVVVTRGFNPQETLSAIEKYKVTLMCLTPTALYSLLAHENLNKFNVSSLEMLFFGAAPIASDRLREAIDVFGDIMAQGYGQTETPNSVTFMGRKEFKDENGVLIESRLKSCGRSSPFTRVEIMDDAGNLLGNNSIGEIVVRGGLVMKGYYKESEATAEVSKNGWHHTGDMAYRDADGYYYICDRKKEVIITGGFNVYPAEVEQAILSIPTILDCAVVGIPDSKWGEKIVAAVELKAGQGIIENEVIEFVKKKIGKIKAPKEIFIVDSLPRSAVGKVVRRKVKDSLCASDDRQAV